MEMIFASNGFKIYSKDNLYPVFKGQDEIDTFASYSDASKTVQDLFISAHAYPEDTKIGVKAFCPDSLGSGNIVLVIGKSADGYVVQKSGGGFRMEVSAEHLSDVPGSITGGPSVMEAIPGEPEEMAEVAPEGVATSNTCAGCGEAIEGEAQEKDGQPLCGFCFNMAGGSATGQTDSVPAPIIPPVTEGEPASQIGMGETTEETK